MYSHSTKGADTALTFVQNPNSSSRASLTPQPRIDLFTSQLRAYAITKLYSLVGVLKLEQYLYVRLVLFKTIMQVSLSSRTSPISTKMLVCYVRCVHECLVYDTVTHLL